MSVIPLPKNAAESLKELGPLQEIPVVRQLGVFALVAAAIALGLWLFFWTQEPDYVPVFAGPDAASSAEASDLLRGANIPFRIESGSGALSVPTDQVGPARLALAASGLTGELTGNGFESFQGDQGFGTSQFVESARYQHAMEVELARTIATLRPVREARVHLAIPKPSAFTRERQPASASVVLNMAGGASLERGQVNAIVHLVANSIPMLAPERVTVVDHLGRMLSDSDPNSEDAMGARRFEQQRRQESTYVQRIQELLAPLTGPGRVSAQVSVDMDFAETEQAREQYGPERGIVRSEQTSESSQGAAVPPSGVPGSASNNPDANALAGEAIAQADPANPAAPAADLPDPVATGPSARTAVRNYEIDRTLTHTRQAPGRINRVTAAVLVDNIPGPPDENGNPTQRPLTADELARVEALVQQAVGFDARRGDSVTVVNAAFAPVEQGEPIGLPFWENPRVRELLRVALGGIALLVLILAVLRPAFRQMLGPRTPRKATPPVATLVEEDEEIPVTLTARPEKETARLSPGAVDAAMDFDEKLQVAKTAVGNDPRRVANVVRNWMQDDE
ncbi:flagellar basal-body MS-ring/collar protein FliF [Novilysobacter defluvii]|uniref:Flagellar M-ring protein n=1 Tax=Lysobacter defluvii IMMIB APB-9 = DSM 18482 TaxID=1385515 RepID=A0A0A0M444_9GAMM|nr:flagellar basal-body MS-ring/collar protein FliF [Lysobacter defluvii]KGO97870.1 flagellar MS-ring protein [Lysobacter defluvii IMMIB APB-9 = DSM 18482]